ncbi:AT-hook motif nuclear-localized protein 14, partial [Linum grandiflorum]
KSKKSFPPQKLKLNISLSVEKNQKSKKEKKSMEQEDTSHHHHHHHHHSLTSYFSSPTAAPPSSAGGGGGGGGPANSSQNNGVLAPPTNNGGSESVGAGYHHMVYPHSVGPSAAPADPVRRKRGRPRKYGTPEQALAAKRTAAAASSASREKSSLSFPGFNKKSNHYLASPGNTGQGFTPHMIYVGPGEDVALKTNMFMQQSKSETCVLSASGVISSATIRQPTISGGNLTYEGRFDIISLTGSYVRTELGGRTGGLSICMSNNDNQIIGGGLSGPLIAAGAVQVIVGTFTLDNKKDAGNGVRIDASSPGGKLPSPVGGSSMSSISFRSPVESSGRNPDEHQTMGGSPFMIHNRGMQMAPSRQMEWRSGTGSGYDLTGRTGPGGGHRSPENGNYDQLPD